MGRVSKPFIIVLLTLIVCSYSQAHRNLRESPGGPDPIHHGIEDPMNSEAYGIYRESSGDADSIHQKIKDHMGANAFKIYRETPTGPNPIHD